MWLITVDWVISAFPVPEFLMGLGIGCMHYLGMGAIRGCGLDYDLGLVAASVVIAITASIAALWFAFYKRTIVTTLVGGVVQGLAIASMHYTAMAATYFLPPSSVADLTTPLFTQNLLAFLIAGAIVFLCTGNLALLGFMSMQQKRWVDTTLINGARRYGG